MRRYVTVSTLDRPDGGRGAAEGVSRCLFASFVYFVVSLRAFAAPLLSLGQANALQGQTVSVDLRVSGSSEACAGVNARVLLPQGVTLAGVERGLLSAEEFATGFRAFPDGGAVIAYCGARPFRRLDGVLLRLQLAVATNAALGTYPISFAETNTNPLVNLNHALATWGGCGSVPDHACGAGSITIDRDGDGDGMGDNWETAHFGSPAAADATTHHDGDGVRDAVEFVNGTNPNAKDTDGDGLDDGAELLAGTSGTDAGDCLEIKTIQTGVEPVEPSIGWDTTTGRTYRVYESTNLLESWSEVWSVPGDGSTKNYATEGGVRRYFRLGVE